MGFLWFFLWVFWWFHVGVTNEYKVLVSLKVRFCSHLNGKKVVFMPYGVRVFFVCCLYVSFLHGL